MNVSTSESYIPHSGNERPIDLDNLPDLDLNTPTEDKDVVGDLDILQRQLDPDEIKKDAVDFSKVRKPTEIFEPVIDEEVSFDAQLESDIEEARNRSDYELLYSLAKTVKDEKFLQKVISGIVTDLVSDRNFSRAKEFINLSNDISFITGELNYVLEEEKKGDNDLADFTQEGTEPTIQVEKDNNDESLGPDPMEDFSQSAEPVNRIKINRIVDPKADYIDTNTGDIISKADVPNEDQIVEENEPEIPTAAELAMKKTDELVSERVVEPVEEVVPPTPVVEDKDFEMPTAIELAMKKTDSLVSKDTPKIEELREIPTAIDIAMKKTDKYVSEPVVEPVAPTVPVAPEVVPPIPSSIDRVDILAELDKDLADSRMELISLETAWRAKNQQSKSWFRKNLLGNLGLDKQTPLIPESSELEHARIVYNLAKKNKLREAFGKGDISSLLQETKKERDVFEQQKTAYKPKVIKESVINRDIRAGVLELNSKEENGVVYETEQGFFAEKFGNAFKKGTEIWNKLPKPVQIATSTAIVTGTSFTFGLAAAAGPLGYAGYRVAKSALMGGVVAQPLGKLVDKKHERKNKASDEESFGEFSKGINIDNFEEKEAERMARDEKMVDVKKRQRLVKAAAKVAVGGITSAGLEMSGASDVLFGRGDINLPGKGTLNVPNDFGDVDRHLDKLEKTRLAVPETLNSDNNLDNLEKLKGTVEDQPAVVTETKVELSSKGFVQDMHNLKANIMAEYGGEVPDSLKPIMDKTPMDLAKAFHFYDPESNASGLGFKGESLGVDSNGDIYYEHLDGNKQIIFDAQKGEFHHFDGEMVMAKSDVVPGSEIYPNGKIGDDVYPKMDFGGNKILAPDMVATPGVSSTEVLEGDPIFNMEKVSVLNVEDTTDQEIANQTIDKIPLPDGNSVEVYKAGEDNFVSYGGTKIGQEGLLNGKKILILDDNFQDGEQYRNIRSAFVNSFEKNVSADVIGPNPIAESFEGGKIYISYGTPEAPEDVRVLLNGKEIADGKLVDGTPKIKMKSNLKGGMFFVDNAYERAFKHINKLIKAGNFEFKK